MSSNRGFIWIDEPSNSRTVANTTVFNSNSTIVFETGDTVITNNSITTQEVSTTNIVSTSINGTDDLPVDFPDGLKSPDIYWNRSFKYSGTEPFQIIGADVDMDAGKTLRVDEIERISPTGVNIDGVVLLDEDINCYNAVARNQLNVDAIYPYTVPDQQINFPSGITSLNIYTDEIAKFMTGPGDTIINVRNNLEFDNGRIIAVDELNESTPGATTTIANGLTTNHVWADATGVLTIHDNLTCMGNVDIQGTLTTIHSEQLNIRDRYIYQNDGYRTIASTTGGSVYNITPVATYQLSGNFVPGVTAFSNPVVHTVATDGLVAGDFIQISGSVSNDGLYEVLNHGVTELVVRGFTVPVVEPFSQSQFTAEVTDGNSYATKVTIAVMQATDSGFKVASGSSAPLTYRLIAYDTASPAFADLSLTSIEESASETKVLVLNGTNEVKYRSAASLATAGYTVSNDAVTLSGGTQTDSLAYVIAQNVNHIDLSFPTDFTMTLTEDVSMLTATITDVTPLLPVTGSIILNIDGVFEECFITFLFSGALQIYRKDRSNFLTGSVIRYCLDAFTTGNLGMCTIGFTKF